MACSIVVEFVDGERIRKKRFFFWEKFYFDIVSLAHAFCISVDTVPALGSWRPHRNRKIFLNTQREKEKAKLKT